MSIPTETTLSSFTSLPLPKITTLRLPLSKQILSLPKIFKLDPEHCMLFPKIILLLPLVSIFVPNILLSEPVIMLSYPTTELFPEVVLYPITTPDPDRDKAS